MTSSVGAKWFIVILIYFVVMTFIVGLISSVSNTPIQTSLNITSGSYCDNPRVSYIPYEQNLFVDMESKMSSLWRNYYGSQIDCKRSLGVRNQDACESLSGCTWEESLEDWWNPFSGAYTCTGNLNYSFITTTGTHYIFPAGRGINDFLNQYGEEVDEICTHIAVLNNETLCDALSCDYRNHTNSLELEIGEPSLGTLGKIWKTAKQMITLRFDFGFDDAGLTILLNFFVFWLPLLTFIISGYVMVRS